jgi:hypothetical protein
MSESECNELGENLRGSVFGLGRLRIARFRRRATRVLLDGQRIIRTSIHVLDGSRGGATSYLFPALWRLP